MSLRISSSDLLTRRTLAIYPNELTYCESILFGGTRHFRFSDIECILLSPDSKLSFQVRNEVFSISVKPNSAQHQQVIVAFVEAVQRAQSGGLAGNG